MLQGDTPGYDPAWEPSSTMMQRARLTEILGCDLRSLGLFRIGLGLVLIYDLLVRMRDLEAFYTDHGVLPRHDLFILDWTSSYWSLHTLSGETWFQAVLFAVAALAAGMLTLGFWTRTAAVASWILLVSVQNRSPLILDNSDILLRVMLFWGLFLPLGRRFSIDARVAARPPGSSQLVHDAATVAILSQWIILYVFAALHKTGVEWHEEASAMHLALDLDQYLEPLGRRLAEAPEGFLRFVTHGVWYFEVLAPWLILMPFHNAWWRLGVVIGFLCFHLGIEAVFFLGNYPKVGIVTLLPLIPGQVWDRLGRKAKPVEVSEPPGPLAGPGLPKGVRIAVGFLLGYVFLWNIGTLPGSTVGVWPAHHLGQFLRLDQAWNMFAPYPDRDDGWYVLSTQLADGSELDLLPFALGTGDPHPVHGRKPEYVSRMYPNARWQGYMGRLWLAADAAHRPLFLSWLCRRWNACHPPSQQVKEIAMTYMLEHSEVDGPETVVPTRIYVFRCH